MNNRLVDQINWYSNKASGNKKIYLWSKAFVICFSALIPLLAGLEICPNWKNLITGLLGSSVAILTGLSSLLKSHDNWTSYRTVSESLKHEKYFYDTKTGPYQNHPNPLNLLVERVEAFISQENSQWFQYFKESNEKNKE